MTDSGWLDSLSKLLLVLMSCKSRRGQGLVWDKYCCWTQITKRYLGGEVKGNAWKVSIKLF